MASLEQETGGTTDGRDAEASTQKPAAPTRTAGLHLGKLAATSLVVLAAVSVVAALYLKYFGMTSDSDAEESYRGFVEFSLTWFSGLFFVVFVPVSLLFLVVSAMRGVRNDSFQTVGVDREESPLAFWYVFVLYLAISVGTLGAIAYLMAELAARM